MSLSKCYSSLLDSMNAEIRIRWLQIVVRNDYYPDLHRVRRFLESQVWSLAWGPASPTPTVLPDSLVWLLRLGIPENVVWKTWHLGWQWVGYYMERVQTPPLLSPWEAMSGGTSWEQSGGLDPLGPGLWAFGLLAWAPGTSELLRGLTVPGLHRPLYPVPSVPPAQAPSAKSL